MLDTATKRRIDTARDILVGKVPDPKSQVEQITIALIYKFMDDIDAASEELGGQRTFFAGDFARYGWPQLVRAGLGGHETLNLYAEAITRMPENPGIPPLFRDIFNNAYLPYRDPETLRAFLKVIDEFTYDHSERLGDAFEYLLSVLGSQGDAGQFRTPRHIIDFIVAVVDPKKDETILDPACGTAGFLISSYRHILKANTDQGGNSTLTPAEKGTLAANFKGYDISPDMVRLSLVNLYLHGFVEPHIAEYDTLTSEERWNEYADVILANPPFMSPKGGIRPHRRFSVQSKRSEVLFVDYIAEHLTPAGRAGIIVPEGIIFQSQTAHKQLRKMLVENYLVAVVSLPAGVFQPYSGVKTSILLLDRALAQKTDRVAFFKVENDGFDLGAQRRQIAENDLPQVREKLGKYLGRLRTGEPVLADGVAEPKADYTTGLGLIAGKEKIAASGEYNLSGERYRESEVRTKTNWQMISLSMIADIESGSRQKGGAVSSGIPSIGGEQIDERGNIRFDKMKFVSEEHFRGMKKGVLKNGDVLVVKDGATTGKTGFFAEELPASVNEHVFIIRARETAQPYYLYSVIRSDVFQERLRPFIKGIIGGISLEIREIQIPLPPLEVQREIVAEIEGYQRVMDGARAVIDNYRPQIVVDPEWPMVELGKVCQVKGGKRLPKGEQLMESPTNHPYIRVSDFRDQSVRSNDLKFISEEIHGQIARYTISSANVYISIAGTIGIMGTIPDHLDGANLTENAAKLSFDETQFDKRFLATIGNDELVQSQIRSLTHAVGVPKLALERIKTLRFPVPPLETQQAIVAEIEAEQSLVAANRELVERMEGKIRAAIGRVWGDRQDED